MTDNLNKIVDRINKLIALSKDGGATEAEARLAADKAQALFALGVSEPVADILAELSPSQMLKIATGNQLLSRFRFDDEMVWSLLAEHGRKVPQGLEANASRLHASIVMAGNFAEAV